MIERDRVWWCWWEERRPFLRRIGWIACGYSRWAMDMRRGVYADRRVRYDEEAFREPDAPPRRLPGIAGLETLFVAAAPHPYSDIEPWGDGMMPVKVDLDVAMRMGLQPPPWKDNLPEDIPITRKDVLRAQSAVMADVVRGPA